MTARTAMNGFGTTLVFNTSAVEVEFTDFDWEGFSRSVIDTSHHGTDLADTGAQEYGDRTKMFGKLVDSGPIKCEGHYTGAALQLIHAARQTCVLTLPLADGETTKEAFTFTGGVSNMKTFKAGIDEKLMCSFDLHISGHVVRTVPS